jgi:hypothetical protein
MQVARITTDLQVDATAGSDLRGSQCEGRSGWKEIVGPGGDRSAGLTAYPQDPMVAPPQS